MSLKQNNNTDELLYVHTPCVSVIIKGTASHPAMPGVEFKEKESTLSVTCDEVYEVSLRGDPETVFLQNLGRAFLGTYRLSPLFFEQQRYEIIIEPEVGHVAEFWHNNFNIRKTVTPVGRKGSILSGVINFGNEIGFTDLVVIVDGKHYLKITIEVFPSKIGYKDDYKAIVADITTEVYNLVFDFLKKTYDSFDINASQKSSPVEFFAIIRKIYDEFIAAADMVIAKPHHLLETVHQVLPGYKIKRIDNQTVRWIEKHPANAIRHDKQILVTKALAVRKYITYDTRENRLIKYMLQTTAERLKLFRKQYGKLSRDVDTYVIELIDGMVGGIDRRVNSHIMREVEAAPSNIRMSLVFGLAPGYRELFRCHLLLQHGLSVTGSVFNVSVKDIAVLYEYWCFIKLNSLMKLRYKLLSQDIIKINGNGLFVSLIKGQRSQVRYINPGNGEMITLSYNPGTINVPTVSQRPDNVLRLEKRGSRIDYEYVFDAKYRVNAALQGSIYEQIYHSPGPQEEDINTMHRYRDAIVYQNNASPYERTMFGAYVLFPYHNEAEYLSHRFYQSIGQVNIGGLPFLPSATDLVTEMLDELISDSPDSAFERATLPAGIEERLAKVDWMKKEVLIGLIVDNNQFEHCMANKYYYTYKRNIALDNLPIYFVALYEKATGIRYYGKILTTQVLRRSEIPGKGRNPYEMCYRFDVDKWIELPKPIHPEQYGPRPIGYTNLFLLTHSTSYPELNLRDEAEYRFYTELKRRSEKAAIEQSEECSGFELKGIKVLFGRTMILVFSGGQLVDKYTIAEFERHPNAVFRRIYRQTKCALSVEKSKL